MYSADVRNRTCGFEGDQDVYGLGIRLGIYLQWFATVLVYNLLPEEISSTQGVNISFQFSVFVALVYRTASSQTDIYAVEAYIMLMLCIGGLSSRRGTYAVQSSLDELQLLQDRGQHITGEMATPIGIFSGFLVNLAILCYGLWYIYTGMDTMQTDPCFESTVFFFARLRLQGPFRRFVAAAFTIGSVFFCIVLWVIVKMLAKIIREQSVTKLFSNIYDIKGHLIRKRKNTPALSRPTEYTWILSVIYPLDLLFFILSTELTINYNSISGVESLTNTGQLIPVVVGGISLLVALYEIWLKWLGDEFRRSPTFHWFPKLHSLVRWIRKKRRSFKQHPQG